MVVVFLATAVEGLAVQRYDVGRAGLWAGHSAERSHILGRVVLGEQVRVDRRARQVHPPGEGKRQHKGRSPRQEQRRTEAQSGQVATADRR